MADRAPKVPRNERTSATRSVLLPMGSGDAVMYQGVNHRHGRLQPNPNSWSAHLFLHWVDADGPHSDQAFDRPALKANGMAGQA